MTAQSPTKAPSWQRTEALRAHRAQRTSSLSLVLPQKMRISDKGFTALDEHKYRPGPYTPLDLFLYRTWWKPFSEVLPRWLAPNALTLIGLSAVVTSSALLVVCSPSFVSATPAWVELLTAFLLIVYQTCDACDGLQARRTGASSPLGELLDHGCDGVTLSAITIGHCVSAQYGLTPLTLCALCVSWVPWWVAQWEAYHTGVVRTGSAVFGVTEIQLIVAGIHVVTAVFGNALWSLPLVGSFEFRVLCIGAQLIVAGGLSVLSVIEVVKTTKSFGELAAAGKRALPLVVLVGVTFAWSVVGPDLHVRAVCAATCALFTRIASELVVCVMTLEPYPRLQPTILLLPCFLVLAMLGVLEGPAGGAALWVYAAYCIFDAFAYVVDVLIEISTHLGVSIFFITPKKEE
mmetsp:Transcript_98234/g.275027  ORF Transcript_98234/g.275027 Transcript_98234/m.275027 type:complete len:404 (-) Transcript_98234:163-1374(-)